MKSKVVWLIVLILSNIGVGLVCYNWASMECSIEHLGASAPASISLIHGVPSILGIVIIWVAYRLSNKKKGK